MYDSVAALRSPQRTIFLFNLDTTENFWKFNETTLTLHPTPHGSQAAAPRGPQTLHATLLIHVG